MLAPRAAAPVLLLIVACRADIKASDVDPIVETWELQSVELEEGCTLLEGELEMVQAEDGTLGGDFEWMASCPAGEDIHEVGTVDMVEVDVSGSDYGLDISLTMPAGGTIDLDCIMNRPSMTCTESGPPIRVFEYAIEGMTPAG